MGKTCCPNSEQVKLVHIQRVYDLQNVTSYVLLYMSFVEVQ